MMSTQGRVRVVQWTTGKVAGESVKAILDRPELELVGLYAYSKEKVGKDVGDLIGLGRRIGITATDDIDALIALKPDCAVYMPLHPDVEHMAKLLRAGVNIATTASFMTGRGYGAEARKKLQEAALAGKASLFGSGVNPGWIDSVVAAASGMCREVNLVKVNESYNIGMWAGDANQDALGWGRPADDPAHAKDIEKATLPFGDAVESIAHMFRFTLDDIRCEVSFAHATEDLELPGRPVKKGTVAGIHATWLGLSSGMPVVELAVQWTLSSDITPAWEIAMAHLVEIVGTPQVKLRVEVLPSDMTLPMEELVKTGFIMTAMPVVNAISAVVAARPGIVGYADLPLIPSVLRPKAGISVRSVAKVAEATAPVTAPASKSAATSAEGTWTMTIKAPTGPMTTILVIENNSGAWGGSQSGQGTTSPILDVKVDGNHVSWVNVVTKPIKLKCEFKAVIDGAQMTGKMKAGIMGSYAFSAVKG